MLPERKFKTKEECSCRELPDKWDSSWDFNCLLCGFRNSANMTYEELKSGKVIHGSLEQK